MAEQIISNMNKSLPIFLAIFLVCGNAFAQWNPDPAINTPVVLIADKGTSAVNGLISAPDGNGGMFIAWTDTRNAGSGADIFVTRILNNGAVAAGFLPGGTPVCTANGLQANVVIHPDGVGGVIIAWGDPRNGNSDIYAQRVNGQGDLLWTANGVPVANGSNSESAPVIELTSFDKVAVVWRNFVPAPSTLGFDLVANFLNLSDGSKVLGSDVTVISKDGAQTNQQILGDGIGGFMVVWTDNRTSTTNATLYGQHVSSSGALLWGPAGSEADGQLIINSAGNVLLPQIATDGSGGLVIAFGSTRVSATDANIYAQRVDFNGIPQWTADGISICTSPSNQTNVRIVKSGPSTVVISWVDRRHSTNVALSDSLDIYAQALNPDGSIKWAVNGNPVVRMSGTQPLSAAEGFEMLGDQLGGAYIVWDENRNANADVYAQRILENGTNGWQANGQPISINTFAQGTPEVVRSGDRLIVAWRDARASSNGEIYASQVQSDGVLPVNILALQARPNGKSVLVQWTSKNEKSLSHFEIERSADAIDFTYAGKTKAQNAAGIFQYSFDDLSPIGGNSFYRLKSVDKDGAFAYSNIVKVSLATISGNDIHLFPNPAYSSANLQLNNLPAGRYSVRVMDMQGRVSQSQQVVISGDHQNVQIPVQRLSIGLYKVLIVNENGERVGQQSLIKQ